MAYTLSLVLMIRDHIQFHLLCDNEMKMSAGNLLFMCKSDSLFCIAYEAGRPSKGPITDLFHLCECCECVRGETDALAPFQHLLLSVS